MSNQHLNLEPVSNFAGIFGVKSLVYGPPGSGKTRLMLTAPNPVILAVEPGLLSVRDSKLPCWFAPTPARIEEFFQWLWNSNEAKQFDTVCVDSMSQIAEVILEEELGRKSKQGNKVDGKAAYGEMATRVMRYVNGLYYMQNKHVCMSAKLMLSEENGVMMKRYAFPGKDILTRIPHLYDEIMYLDETMVPSVGTVKALRTKSTFDIVARDRSGVLAELEQPDLTYIFNKIMKGITQ